MKAKHESPSEPKARAPDSLHKQVQAMMREHESRLWSLFDTMTEGVVLIAPDGQIVEANPSAARILGLTHREITGRNYNSADWKILRPDGTRMPVQETAGPRAMREERPVKNMIMGVERSGGSITWLNVNASPLINAAGKLEGVVGTFADITEHKKAEEAIEQSERNYRLLAGNTSDVVSIWDLDLNLVWVSPSVEKQTGYTVEEMKSIPPDKTMTPESIEKAMAVYNLARQSHEEGKEFSDRFEMEAEVYRKDGSTFWSENRYQLIRDGQGNPAYILMGSRDITERRRAEQALRESEQHYRTLVETIPQKIFLKDKNSVYISCNSNYAEDLKIKPEEIAGHTDYDFYPRDLAEKYRADDRSVMEAGNTQRVEERYIRQGQERVVQTFKTPFRDDSGELVGVMGIFHDITEHKKADEALRVSEQRFRNLTDLLPQTVFEVDEEGDITFANREAYKIFGYSEEDVARGINVLQTIAPEDRARAAENLRLRLNGDELPSNEYTAVRKDGSEFPVMLYARSMIRDGRYAGMRGILVDISDRKQAEEALRQSEERYRLIADNTSDSIWALGPDLRMTYQSPSCERLFGYTLQEWQRMGWSDFVHPDYVDIVTNVLKSFRHRRDESSATIAVRVRGKHKQDLWAEIAASPIRGRDGELAGIVGVTRDITERKQAEARLVEYKTAVEQSVDGIALADMDGHIRFVNEACVRMHGYATEELIGRHLSIFHTGEQYESVVVPFNLRLVETGSNSGEMWHVRRDGRVFPTWMTTTVLKDADQKPLGLLAIMRDITERKGMERERRDREIAEARAQELSRSRRRLIGAQESLRKEIAGQLHGTVQNRLILLAHKVAELEARPPSERTTEELADIHRKLEDLQDNYIRPIGRRLFPSILRLGIVAGLESLVDDYGVELSIDLRVGKQLRDREQASRRFIPDDVKLALYRIAEESLANILKHTPAAKNIAVRLSLSNGRICLAVSDDAGGFDTASPGNGMGLALMSDYAAAAGGSYAIKSIPGRGTRVTARVPLPGLEAEKRRKRQPSG